MCISNLYRRLPAATRAVALSLVVLIVTSEARAGAAAGEVLDDLVRESAKITDEIPIRDAAGVAVDLAESSAAREAVENELRAVVPDAGKMTEAARAAEVSKLLEKATLGFNPELLGKLKTLDAPTKETALVLVDGGNTIAHTMPDLAERGRLLADGGPETVATAGLFGDEAAHSAAKLDEAIRGGTVAGLDGRRAVTLADFGTAMSKGGKASWSFWKTYVVPNWKVWATTGALTAYLLDPQAFEDGAGRLTEQGFRKLEEFVGKEIAAAIRGVVPIPTPITQGYQNRYAILGAAGLLLLVVLWFRRLRYYLLTPYRWLHGDPSRKPV